MSITPFGPLLQAGLHNTVRPAQENRSVPQPSPPTPQSASVHPAAAAEELGFGIKSQHKGLAAQRETESLTRSVEERTLLDRAYRLSRLEGVYTAFDKHFWNTEVSPGADDAAQAARQHDGIGRLGNTAKDDPFKQYIVLLEAKQRLGEDEPAQRRLDVALDALWAEHRLQIVAGFNTMGPALRFARDIGEWNAFREIYLGYVIHGELAKTFRALLSKFGPARVRSAIETLRNAILADLASPIVCADKTRWQQEHLDLVDNQRILSLIAAIDEFCSALPARDPSAETVMSFVGSVLDFAAGPNERKLNALCSILVPEEAVNEVLRQRVKEFLKKHLPLQLWGSIEARDTVFAPVFRPKY